MGHYQRLSDYRQISNVKCQTERETGPETGSGISTHLTAIGIWHQESGICHQESRIRYPALHSQQIENLIVRGCLRFGFCRRPVAYTDVADDARGLVGIIEIRVIEFQR